MKIALGIYTLNLYCGQLIICVAELMSAYINTIEVKE